MAYREERTGKKEYSKRFSAGEREAAEAREDVVVGRNAVLELLRSGRTVDKLFLQKGQREGSAILIAGLAKERGVPIVEAEKQKLDALSAGLKHQGVAAIAAQKEYVSLDDILKIAADRDEPPFLVLCDGIDDPGNLGAIIRCAEGAGAHGVVIPKRRSVGLTAAVARASAGAVEHVAVARVPNLASAIDELKKAGVWIYGAEAGGASCFETDMKGAVALVMGSEGEGISHLVKEKCDFIVSIGMYGRVNSFNVSCASAVLLCEIARQRHGVQAKN